MNWKPFITADPTIMHGAVCFRGTRVPVSVAYPMLSIGYIVNAFAAWWLFGESLAAQKLIGIGFIVVGVWLVAKS